MRSVLSSTLFRVSRTVALRVSRSPPFPVALTCEGVRLSALRPFSAASDGLVDILKREYDEEKENETAVMPADLKDLYDTIKKRDWKIVEEGAMTRLFSTSGSAKVQIFFHCQDRVDDETQYEEESVEEVEEPPPAFRFTVTVSKAGKNMVFVCLSKDAQCTIDSVNVTKADVADLDNGVPAAQYQGPEFYELAADLQDSFYNYLLADIGIDEDMAAFISMYADYKEQVEYVDFLENARNLLG